MAAHTLVPVVMLQHCHRAGCTYNCKRDTEPDISVISTDARARRTAAAARASVSARVPSGIRVRSSGRRCKAPPFFLLTVQWIILNSNEKSGTENEKRIH